MRATASEADGNLVRLSVELDEEEVDNAVRQTARRLAGQLKVPGFRPGKVPRKVLEARLGGSEVLREQAIRDVLPDMYAQAVVDTDLDPIAPPDIDIVSGADHGAVAFDAVVQVRPTVSIPGYGGLVVTLPSVGATDEDVDTQIDRLRDQFGELVAADRPAAEHDHVTINLRATRPGSDDVEVEDFLYEVGSRSMIPGLDEQLMGAKPGDILQFEALLPTADGAQSEWAVKVLVKDVKKKVLPEPTDGWAKEASEFDTLGELRTDLRDRISRVKLSQARLALQERSLEALVGLVEDAPPEPLIESEVSERLHDLAHRLEGRNMTVSQFLRASGQDEKAFVDGLRIGAERSVKADLALRALADAEDLQVTDKELEQYFDGLAEQTGLEMQEVRDRIDRNGRLAAVRSEQRKQKAADWLVEHVGIVDENGDPIDRSALEFDDETKPADAEVEADDGGESTGLAAAEGELDEGEQGEDGENGVR
jgi:trigger factor